MTKNTENIIIWILRGGIVALLFLPLYANFAFFFPFIAPRAAAFQIITSILFILTIYLFTVSPSSRPRFTKLTWALLAYFAVTALTTIFAFDPSKSFVGTVERSFGFYHILHFGMLFFIATAAFRTWREWMIFWSIAVSIAVLPELHFFFQKLTSEATAPNSIMGNQTFLAAYALIHFFITAYILQHTKSTGKKWILIFLMAIHAIAVITTGVRGGFVGLSMGIIYILLAISWKHKTWRANIIGILLILIASYALLFLNRDSDFIRKNYVLYRVTNFSLEDETIKARFSMWRSAWAGFKERPILGWGRESFSVVFNLHYHPSFNTAGVGEGWEDRTHNIFMDELSNNGILGLLGFLTLIGIFAWHLRHEPALFALAMGYTIQGLFGVESFNSYLLFFLFLAFVDLDMRMKLPPMGEQRPFAPILLRSLSGAGILLVTVSLYFFTIKPLQANYLAIQSFLKLGNGEPAEFQKNLEKSKKTASHLEAYRTELLSLIGTAFLQFGEQFMQLPEYIDMLNIVINDLDALSKKRLAEQRYRMQLSQLYMQRALLTQDMTSFEKGEEIVNELLTASPQRKNFYELKSRSDYVKQILLQAISSAQNNPSKK